MIKKDLFVRGKNGYAAYRIPALVVTKKNSILAFCEARKLGKSDTGDIDMVMKRSVDGGKTWSRQQLIYEVGGDKPITIGNPVPIVDSDGTVHLLLTQDYGKFLYMKSMDDGLNWTVPVDFTSILDGFNYQRVLIASGPCHGIQMKNGRLVAPIWMSDRSREERYKGNVKSRIRAGVIYSDDLGKTWKAGGLVPADIDRLHEATVVELSNGELMINMRARTAGYRCVSFSKDGGLSWTKPYEDKQLPDPVCQGSLLKYSENEILFTNPAVHAPAHSKTGIVKNARRNLVLRMSKDDGKSWPFSTVINKSFSGYSDLAKLADGTILCIYECGEKIYREKITFVALDKARLK
ncbi:MAG: glycoside hydrolase [Lentisphaeraceae bacterium]|nr:glycoside hydrolase [Lentisphaeraceae bacterium]